jgi:hypothetical protein
MTTRPLVCKNGAGKLIALRNSGPGAFVAMRAVLTPR